MKRALFVAPLLVSLLLVGCGDDASSDPGVEIDPVAKCSGPDCPKQDTGDDKETDSTPAPAAPEDGKAPKPAPAPATTDPVNTCQTAVDLGEMNGEPKAYGQSAETFAAQGHCSKWVKVRVIESSSAPWISLKVKATLISPTSHKFDLYGYVNADKDEIECTTPTKSSASTLSSVDEIKMDWSDHLGSDDSRWATFEVRAKNGCDDSASWSLLVSSVSVNETP